MDTILPVLGRYRIPIKPRQAVINRVPGEWESPYRGAGYEPVSFRDFVLGDDPRRKHIPTSIRRGTPTVIERIALSDVTIMVLIDTSLSMRVREKWTVQRHAAALLLHSALKLESSFGLCAIGAPNDIGRPRRGYPYFSYLYSALNRLTKEDNEKVGGGADFLSLFAWFRAHVAPRSIVFIISDFLGDAMPQGDDFRFVRMFARRYDIIAVVVQDSLEYKFPYLPHGGEIPLCDVESGSIARRWISPDDSTRIGEFNSKQFALLGEKFSEAYIPLIHVENPDPAYLFERFTSFFSARRRR